MDEDVGTGVDPSERAHHAGAGGSTPERRGRMSARRKQEAVLRLLRGEDLELLSRQLGVTAAELSGWRGAFLAAGEVSSKTRPTDARDAEIGRLKEKVGDLTMANELLGAKIERLEADRPLARRRLRPTPRDGSRGDPGGDEPPGLALRRQDLWPAAVTRIWGVSRATIYRNHRHLDDVRCQRPGPLGAMADKDLVVEIRQLLQDSPV